MNNLLHLIADYGVGDPAYAEVIQKFAEIDPTLRVHPVNVPKFSTIATGFWIAQLATVNPFPELIIFSNTAPRINLTADESRTYRGKYGHLALAELDNGVNVIAVHVGFAFSFIKAHIRKFHLVNVPNEGSQFRSRDFYPQGVVNVIKGAADALGDPVPLESIPDVPAHRIAFVDGYGNMKTTTRASHLGLKQGEKITISLNGIAVQATIGGDTFSVADGDLCFGPGSSGGKDRFMEIWIKGGSAWEVFGKPRVEEPFTLLPVE